MYLFSLKVSPLQNNIKVDINYKGQEYCGEAYQSDHPVYINSKETNWPCMPPDMRHWKEHGLHHLWDIPVTDTHSELKHAEALNGNWTTFTKQ